MPSRGGMRRACGAGSWIASLRARSVAILIALLLPAWRVLFLPSRFCRRRLGVWVERWLFFAEARHVSMLYYGATLGGAEAPAQ
jgi:DMSO reductase anchor subunit